MNINERELAAEKLKSYNQGYKDAEQGFGDAASDKRGYVLALNDVLRLIEIVKERQGGCERWPFICDAAILTAKVRKIIKDA